MLEKMIAKNFQAHADLELTFDPKITVIVGPTDSGKSSTIRMLRWACLNQPRGSEFLRHGEDSLSVKVQIDGHTVERSKKKEANHYALDETEFTAFGVNIPETVSSFLKMDDLNFQQQHDAPFWLALSAGEVSRQLNSIVDLEIIDRTTATIKAKVLDQKRQIDRNMEKLRAEKKKVDDLAWTVEANSSLNHLNIAATEIASISSQVTTLKNKVAAIDNTNVQAALANSQLNAIKSLGKQLQEIIGTKSWIEKCAQLLKDIKSTRKVIERGWVDVSSLEHHIAVCEKTQSKISSLRKLVSDITVQQKKIKTKIVEPNLDKQIEDVGKKSQQVLSFSNMLRAIRRAATRADETRALAEQAHTEFEEVCVGGCPICGGAL